MTAVQQLAARMNSEGAASLARSLKAMPDDKLAWKPLETGRDALSQVQESAALNPWFAQMLRDRSMPPLGGEEYARITAELNTPEKALAALERSVVELNAATEAFPDAHLADTINLPWGESTFEDLLFMAYWNMVYHLGQTNYIQTLYGDMEMH